MTQLIYDQDKLRIRICGGMNCSGNGGGSVLEAAFQRELEQLEIDDEVEIFRAHCLGECHSGPCVRIAGERFYHVKMEDVAALIREEVLPKLNK